MASTKTLRRSIR